MSLLEWISLCVGIIGILTGISAVSFYFFKVNSNCEEIKRIREIKIPEIYKEIYESFESLEVQIKNLGDKIENIQNGSLNKALEYQKMFSDLKDSFTNGFKIAMTEVITELKDYVKGEVGHIQKQIDDIKRKRI